MISPDVSATLDWEGELVAIIGKAGRHIAPEDALSHVFGWSIYNEASVRAFQHHSSQFGMGKNFEGTGAFGPCVVTADAFGDPYAGRIETRLNGEVVQSAPIDQMTHRIEDVIAYLSQATTLLPGRPGLDRHTKRRRRCAQAATIHETWRNRLGHDFRHRDVDQSGARRNTCRGTGMSDQNDLLELEAQRCAAISTGNVEALNAMLRDDYIHVYGGGLSSGKADWIDHISEVPRVPERVDMQVRVYGDTAVLTGKMINRIRPNADVKPAAAIGDRVPIKEDVQAFATQVAVRENGKWQFCSFQMTRCVD